MARKEDMTNSNYGGYKFGVFVVNETSVGKDGQNSKRSDVQLVQFFLGDFFIIYPGLAAGLPTAKDKRRPVALDGKYGQQTEKAILIFQQWAQAQGKTVKADGLVSVPRGVTSPISQNSYTILLLNAWFQKHGKDKADHGELETNLAITALAPELSRELARKKVTDQF